MNKLYPGTIRPIENMAAKGDSTAQLIMGILCEEACSDVDRAAEFYTAAAKQGNAEAQFRMGQLLRGGHGIVKDTEDAVGYLENAASGGHSTAMSCLSHMYECGQEGLPKSPKDAEYWRQRSVHQAILNGRKDRNYVLDNCLRVWS